MRKYKVRNQLTPEEVEIIIIGWADVEMRQEIADIRDAHGYTRDQMTTRVHHIRNRLKAEGDDRWKGMNRRRDTSHLPYNPDEEIIDYGVVHAPDIYEDKDPRPVWLVITSHRFKLSPTEQRDAHPGR